MPKVQSSEGVEPRLTHMARATAHTHHLPILGRLGPSRICRLAAELWEPQERRQLSIMGGRGWRWGALPASVVLHRVMRTPGRQPQSSSGALLWNEKQRPRTQPRPQKEREEDEEPLRMLERDAESPRSGRVGRWGVRKRRGPQTFNFYEVRKVTGCTRRHRGPGQGGPRGGPGSGDEEVRDDLWGALLACSERGRPEWEKSTRGWVG